MAERQLIKTLPEEIAIAFAELRRSGFRAIDIKVPRDKLKLFEELCDEMKLPCYLVAEDTVSIALSYYDLYQHELRR